MDREVAYTGKGGEILQGGSLRSSSSDDNGVLHGIVLLEGLDELSDGRSLLANSDVNAVELLLLVAAAVPAFLVEDGVQSDGSLAGLTITDDQLTLASADRDHSIDGLQAGLHGLPDGLARQNAGCLELGSAPLLEVDGAFAINGVSQSVDDTSKQLGANRDIHLSRVRTQLLLSFEVRSTHNFTGSLDRLTLLDETIGTEEHNTDLAGLEVHAHALDARSEPVKQIRTRGVEVTTRRGFTYSTSSSAWTLAMPCTRAIPSLRRPPVSFDDPIDSIHHNSRDDKVGLREVNGGVSKC